MTFHKISLSTLVSLVCTAPFVGFVAQVCGDDSAEIRFVSNEEKVSSSTDEALDEAAISLEANLPETSPLEGAGEPSSSPPAPLSSDLINLRTRLRKVLALYYPKHLDARERSCWEVMHGIIAYGVDAKLFRNGPDSEKVNAAGWMCYNQPCHGEQLFYLDHGKIVARRGPGLQGHLGQFLAIIAQSHVPADFPMQVGGKKFTVQDLIEHEKSDCHDGEELTFKLIGLSHYLNSDDQWTTKDGEKWNIPRLIREELKQPILRVAACGGTHRLMGHSYAIYKRRKQGKPIDGQFARAEKFIADYHRFTFGLQNSDGSFSTKWFEGREAKPDIDRRLKTTGHTFEWMSFSVPEEKLRDPRMIKTANYLVDLLLKNNGHEWEVGPQGHALHALRIYDRRLFKPHDAGTTPIQGDPPATAKVDREEKPALETAQKPKIETAKQGPRQNNSAASKQTIAPRKNNNVAPESPAQLDKSPPAASEAPDVPPIELAP